MRKHRQVGVTGLRQTGQAAVEYTVVTIVMLFGILAIYGEPDPNQQGKGVFDRTREVIQSNYEGYSFAVSLAEYPDIEASNDYEDFLVARSVPDEYADYLSEDPLDYLTFIVQEYLLPNLPGLGDLDLGALLGSF